MPWFVDTQLKIGDDRNEFASTNPLAVFNCQSDANRGIFTLTGTNRCGGLPLATLATSCYVGVTARSSREVPIANCVSEPWPSGEAVFTFTQSVALRDITDGISQTVVVGERSCRPFPSAWAGALPKGEHARSRVLGLLDSPPQPAATVAREDVEFGSYHPAGSQFLLADGSVRMVDVDIGPALFRAICTHGGGETVAEFFVDD